MPKQLVNSFMSNKIYWANVNNKSGMISDNNIKDVTDEAIKVVFQHMKNEFDKKKKEKPDQEEFAYIIDGFGRLTFTSDSEQNKRQI